MKDILHQTRTVTNGDATIAYSVCGSEAPEAVTLCLLASTGRGPGDFSHLATYLAAAGLRVVLPWPRGMGDSSGPLEGIDFHDLAGDAAAALEAEAAEGGAVIVGHAYGCWIARTVAQDRPDLVDGIVLLAAGGGSWPAELSKGIEVAMNPHAPEADRLAALQMGFFAEGTIRGLGFKVGTARSCARSVPPGAGQTEQAGGLRAGRRFSTSWACRTLSAPQRGVNSMSTNSPRAANW